MAGCNNQGWRSWWGQIMEDSVVSQVRKGHSDYGKNKKQNKTEGIRGKQDGNGKAQVGGCWVMSSGNMVVA